MLFAMVSSWSGEISLAIFAGRSASTVAGAQTSLSSVRVELVPQPVGVLLGDALRSGSSGSAGAGIWVGSGGAAGAGAASDAIG